MAFRTDFEVDKGADENSRLASVTTPPMKFEGNQGKEGKGASNFRIIFLGHRDTKKRQLNWCWVKFGFLSQLFTNRFDQKSRLIRRDLLSKQHTN